MEKLRKNRRNPDALTITPEIYVDHRFFRYCLAISFLVHLAVLFKFSYYNFFVIERPKKIDIQYYDVRLESKKSQELAKKQLPDKTKDLAKTATILREKDLPSTTKAKEIPKPPERLGMNKQPATLASVHLKRKVSVPALKSEKIDNPFYQNYYETVRTMIKKRAYANYSKVETGEVYMTFVVLSDGTLKQAQLIEEKTSAQDYLREVSLRSVQECNPFPHFPPDLTYPELSFNVVISFEMEE